MNPQSQKYFIAVILSIIAIHLTVASAQKPERIRTTTKTESGTAITFPEEIRQFFPQTCRFSGTFTQAEQSSEQEPPEYSNGVILFDCELGMILKTQAPVAKTEVLTAGSNHYVMDAVKGPVKLNGIANRLRAKLLLSMMRGDVDYMLEHFDFEVADSSTLHLHPKSSTYKRGLKLITLRKVEHSTRSIKIQITDRRGGKSMMTAHVDTGYESAQEFEKACEVWLGPQFYSDTLKPLSD